MTMEEIYKFAGWTPESWLDPAMAEAGSKLGGDGRNGGGTDASISSMNTNYDAFSMLHNSTPMRHRRSAIGVLLIIES